MIRRWRNLVARRGRFLPVPPAQPLAAPSRVPDAVRRRARPAVAARGGEFLSVPQPTVTVPPARARRRLALPAVRRGKFLPVLALPAAPAGFMVGSRAAAVLQRRGEFITVPLPVVVAPGSGPLPPAVCRQVRRPHLPTRRGEYFTPVPAAQVPLVPGFVPRPGRRAVARSLLIRRGEFLLIPPAPGAVPPKPLRRGAPRLVVTRRGEFFGPVPPAAVVTPASWVPTQPRVRRPVLGTRSGVFLSVPLVGATAPPHWTPAKDPHVTIRPNLSTLAVASNQATLSAAANLAALTITEEA